MHLLIASSALCSIVLAAQLRAAPTPKNRLALASMAALGTAKAKTEISNGQTATTRAVQILDLPFGPVLIAKRSIKDGCHACTGGLDIFYLSESGRGFKVRARYPAALEGWGWGKAPKYQVTNRFTGWPALYSEASGGGQGYFCFGAMLLELTPKGPVQSDDIATGYSNSGAADADGPAREAYGKITNVRKAKSFEVQFSGSESFTEKYVYKGGHFVRIEKKMASWC